MIVYQMGCAEGHHFEGWFASAEACDTQAGKGQLECPSCGSSEVRKLPTAPHVHTSAAAAGAPKAADAAKAIAALRTFILSNTEDVGRKFAEIARRIHYKEEDARNVRGQVSAEEAAELQEEGVEAYSLPPGLLPPGEEVH